MNTQTIELLKENGFTLEKTFSKTASIEKLNTWNTVSSNGKEILYISEIENGNYDTMEFLNYPTAFPKNLYNIDLSKLLTVLKSITFN